jgi:hypothetical protein
VPDSTGSDSIFLEARPEDNPRMTRSPDWLIFDGNTSGRGWLAPADRLPLNPAIEHTRRRASPAGASL